MKIKNEFHKLIFSKAFFIILFLTILIPFLCAFLYIAIKQPVKNIWQLSYYINECTSKEQFLNEITKSKDAIIILEEQYNLGQITLSQYNEGVLLANKRIAIYEYAMANNISYSSSAPMDTLLKANPWDNKLYFFNFFTITIIVTVGATSLLSTIRLNNYELDSKVTRYIYQGSFKKRKTIQLSKLLVIFVSTLIVFLFETLFMFIFGLSANDSINTIMRIGNDCSITCFNKNSLTLFIILSAFVDCLFYLFLFYSLSKLFNNLSISIIFELVIFFIFTFLPGRFNNHYFSLFTEPFFNLYYKNFETSEIVFNVLFKFISSVILVFISNYVFSKREF